MTPVDTIVIPTCDRAASLSRCLNSLLETLKQYGRFVRIIVADSSADIAVAQSNRHLVENLASSTGIPIQIFGRNEKISIIRNFRLAGFDHEVVEFAISGDESCRLPGTGANRNLLSLASVGSSFLSIDDDTEARFFCSDETGISTGCSGKVASVGHESPLMRSIYSSRSDLLMSRKLRTLDFLAAHEGLLGYVGETGTVGITLGGLIGDCGWGTASNFLFINPNRSEGLIESDDKYLVGVGSREMVQVASTFCTGSSAHDMMSTFFACNQAFQFPPFFPVARGQDMLFGRLSKMVNPAMNFGYVPCAIFHNPLNDRKFWPQEVLRSAGTTDFCTFISCLIDGIDAPTSNFADCMIKVGRGLIEIGGLSTEAFIELALECRRRTVVRAHTLLQHHLESATQANPLYRKDLWRYIDTLVNEDVAIQRSIPIELLYHHCLEAALVLVQSLISRYGELLLSWDEMRKIAARMF